MDTLSYVGDAVVNVYINHEKKFAFVEMRTVEEASNAMALDGIMFEVCILMIFSSGAIAIKLLAYVMLSNLNYSTIF
jgi:hypothetical protein